MPKTGNKNNNNTSVPTLAAYIAAQIANKRTASLNKSRNRTMPAIPIINGTPNKNSCIYTATDNYGNQYRVPGNWTFYENPGKYGFKPVSLEQAVPGDIIQVFDKGAPYHAMTLDSFDEQGRMKYNYSRGSSGDESDIVKASINFPNTKKAAYTFVGTPADSTQWANEYKRLYGNQMKCGGRRKAQLGLDIREGGIAIPIAPNMYYMNGRSHDEGGIGIGPNNKNGLEVEGGEVVKVGDRDIKVFSSVPLLRGVSPAQLVMGGANPNKVFKAQEDFKDKHRINDDGTRYEIGGEKIYTPSNSIQRQIQKTGKITIGGAPTVGGLRTFSYLRGLANARKYGAKGTMLFRAGKELIKRGTQKLVDAGKITKEVAQIPRSVYGQFVGANGQNLPKTINLINDNNQEMKAGGIYIKPSKRGTFTAAAKKHSIGVQEFASKVLGNKEDYSSAMVKKANFARNASRWKKEYGGDGNVLPEVVVTGKKSKTFFEKLDDYADVAEKALAIPNMALSGYSLIAPNPYTAAGAYLTGLAGGGIDIYQGIRSAIKGDWHNVGKNAIDLGVSLVGLRALRNANNLNSLDKALDAAGAPREYVTRMVGRGRGRTRATFTKEKDKAMLEEGIGYGTIPASAGLSLVDTDKPRKKKEYGGSMIYTINGNVKNSLMSARPKAEYGIEEDDKKKKKKYNNPMEARYASRVQKGQSQEATKPNGNHQVTNEVTADQIRYTRSSNFGKSANQSQGSTGGQQQDKINERLIPQFKSVNTGDWIGLGSNLVGHIASYFINNNLLKNYPMPAKPVMAPVAKLKTRYNINPQLTETRETELVNRTAVRRNSQSSNTSLAREQRIINEARNARNQLYGQKENIETQLINQDRLNRQTVAGRNVAAYNDWLNKTYVAKTNKILAKQHNLMNLINGIPNAVTNIIGNIDSRRNTNNTIKLLAAANPNVDGRLLGIGDYHIGEITKKRYDKFGNLING